MFGPLVLGRRGSQSIEDVVLGAAGLGFRYESHLWKLFLERLEKCHKTTDYFSGRCFGALLASHSLEEGMWDRVL